MASKSRKRVFPKPVPRLNSKTVKELGKNSNKLAEYYHVPIYATETPVINKELSAKEKAVLVNLRKNLNKRSSHS